MCVPTAALVEAINLLAMQKGLQARWRLMVEEAEGH
jgi:hypothetical protein